MLCKVSETDHTELRIQTLTLKKKEDLGHLTERRPFGNVDYPAERLYYSGFSRETKPIGCIRI